MSDHLADYANASRPRRSLCWTSGASFDFFVFPAFEETQTVSNQTRLFLSLSTYEVVGDDGELTNECLADVQCNLIRSNTI